MTITVIVPPRDSDLTALEDLTETGLIARASEGVFYGRTVTGTAAQIGVTNGDGVSGSPVLALLGHPLALSGLTGAADKMSYWTSSSAMATTSLTSFGRSLIDDAGAAAARTTMGLTIGTDVQAYNANLTALAALFEFVNPSLDMRTTVSASRGELRLIPNDTGARDADAGGELTVVANDTDGATALAGNQAVGVFYIQRVASANASLLIRTLSYGTEPQLPIRFSADGGTTAGEIQINNELHWKYPAAIEPTYFPATRVPTLTLKGQVPSLRLQDTEEVTPRDWEVQNVENTFRVVDQLAVATRLSIDATGYCSVPAGFIGPLTGDVIGDVTGESLILAKTGAGGPVVSFSSPSPGTELKIELNSKDAATDNNFKITLNLTAYGQIGLYDVTGAAFVWDFVRDAAAAAPGVLSFRTKVTVHEVATFVQPPKVPSYTVAALPTGAALTSLAYATNACNSGESTGNGTGSLVTPMANGTNWKIPGTVGPVTA